MKYIKISVEYLDWMEKLDREARGNLFTAMLEYARDGAIQELEGDESILWPVVRSQLDRLEEQYRKVCAANAANARKKASDPKRTAPLTERTVDREMPAPVQENAVSAREKTAPVQENTVPAREEVAPIRQETASVRENAVPVTEQAAPVWQNPIPSREELFPILKDLALSSAADVPAADLEAVTKRMDRVLPLNPPEPRRPAYPPAPVAVLPFGRNEDYPVYPNKAAEWSGRFPGVDVLAELRKMQDWLLAHPDRLTARKDVIPFILRWLEKNTKQRPSGSAAASASASGSASSPKPSFDLDEIYRLMISNSGG